MTDFDSSASGVQPGQVLAGKYRIDRVIAEGGMGVVVAAHHIQLDQRVALKFLLPEALKNEAAVARFVREARTAVKIQSEHVARVTDVGQLENGAPYIVMEYLEGGDLEAWVRKRGALSIDQAVDFLLQTCVAVADAHALGVIHRDLKPANLFCVRRSDGQLSIKVLDFGISKLTDPAAAAVGMTKTNSVMGTPLYMSPEQMQSTKTVDSRTDIWALGVSLFELLAGRAPFEGETVMELALRIANEPPPPLKDFRPDVPADLEAVILKCIEKDPNRRYSNVAEVAVALLPFAPPRARGQVERISGIIHAAGLSGGARDMRSSPSWIDGPTKTSAATLPAVESTAAITPSPRPPATRVVAIVLVAGLLLIAVALGKKLATSPDVPTPSTSAAASRVSSESSETSAASSASTAASPSSALPSAAPVLATGSPSALPPAQGSKNAARPGGTPSTATSSTAKPSVNCDPPYTLDEENHRHHKPECP